MPSCEIHPPRRSVPRYCPDQALPSYRYVPGLHPHPLRDSDGHSYNPAPRRYRRSAWSPTDWRHLVEWLTGVDRFNTFYFWEAHESWESLWAAMPRISLPARVLQGLIQISGAMLKIHLGSVPGAALLARHGVERLSASVADSPHLMGLDLRETSRHFHRYFRPLAERTLPRLDASVPVLRLLAVGDA